MWRALILLGLATLWGLICLRTIVFQESVAFSTTLWNLNIEVATGKGNIAVMTWPARHFYLGVLWTTQLISGSETYSERLTGHGGWLWALIPLVGYRGGSTTFTVPTVLVFLLLSTTGILELRRSREVRRERLVAERRCEFCEYDLRASTGRCPECGAVIPEG
jgi:hypothetical protein